MTQIKPLTKEEFKEFDTDPADWLAKQAQAYGLKYLLAHTDDGVIWGQFQNGRLVTSGDAFAQVAITLRYAILQQARLFGPNGELFIWRSGKEFNGRFLTDNNRGEAIEDIQLLWGEASDPPGPKENFALMRDGRQGLLHAPPKPLPGGQRAGLKVRHYLDYDAQGQAYITLSRLVDVVSVKED